jgi:flagellar protein FlgJ
MFEAMRFHAAQPTVSRVAASDGKAKTDPKLNPKLVDGARQFEAMMLEQMLKPMHFGSSPDAAGEEDARGSNDSLSGFGTVAVARALAGGKGFGLARQIVRQVSAEHQVKSSSAGGTKVP